MPAARPFCLDWPGILHPTAFVDVVDKEVAICAPAEPKEAMEVVNLILKLVHVFRLLRDGHISGMPSHSISPQHCQIADRSVLDPLEHLTACLAVPAHEADSDFQFLLLRLLCEF